MVLEKQTDQTPYIRRLVFASCRYQQEKQVDETEN